MRRKIEQKRLAGDGTAVFEPAMNGDRASGNDHDGSEVERVKRHPCHQIAALHQLDRKSENVGAITHIAFQFEMDPSKHERKGYKRRQNAAPHDQKMHQPAKEAAFENKMLAD